MKIFDLQDCGLNLYSETPQTALIQHVLDLVHKEGGGCIVFPKGEYVTGGLLLYSHTTICLKDGAHLLGSLDPADYPVFPIPAGIKTRTDVDMQPSYFVGPNAARPEYRRALFSAYGAEDIAIIGEGTDSVIDGRDCYDPEGEEGLRGPHGIFFSNCSHIRLQDYVIKNCGNFHHQMDANEHVEVLRVSAFGGHDGFHMHCSRDVLLDGCVFYTGDDCFAGVNMKDVTLKNCTLNTSCQLFRIGGSHIHVEDCRMYGPGVYPYRRSVMTAPGVFGPRENGHHEINSFMEYFASQAYPEAGSEDIVFRNCTIENVRRLLWYRHDVSRFEGCHFCAGSPLLSLRFENVRISGLKETSETTSSAEAPLTVTFIDTVCTDPDGRCIRPFSETSENLILIGETD